MKIAHARRFVAGTLLVLLASCTLLTPASVEVTKQVINKLPQTIPQGPSTDARLLILDPEAAPAYDTTRMAYIPRRYEIAYFADTEWADKPAAMIHALLVETLRRSNRFSEVVTAPYFDGNDYELRATLVELTQDHSVEPPAMRIGIRFQLKGGKAGAVVAMQELSLQAPLTDKTPYAGVVAANDAAAEMVREIARIVVETAGDTRDK